MCQGEIPLNDNTGDPKFPAFLYDEDIMDGSFATGLLRGKLLLAVRSTSQRQATPLTTSSQVYTSIFISPSSAAGAKASLKRGNAKIHGMEKVIPSTICYAVIHVCANHRGISLNLTLLSFRYTWRCVLAKHGGKSGKASSFHTSICFSESNLPTQMIPGVSKLSSGGMSLFFDSFSIFCELTTPQENIWQLYREQRGPPRSNAGHAGSIYT